MEHLEQLPHGIVMQTIDGVFPLSTDSVVLGDFIRLPKQAKICDLGCGAGTLGLLLCGKDKLCQVTGIELQDEAYHISNLNISRNNFNHRFTMLHMDICDIKSQLPAGAFTHVVSNPPYFPLSGGNVARGNQAIARAETNCSIEDICLGASWLLQSGGTFSLVHKPERLSDVFYALRKNRLEVKRLCFVKHRPDTVASMVLIEGKKDGKPSLKLEKDLILFTSDGQPTADYDRIYNIKGVT